MGRILLILLRLQQNGVFFLRGPMSGLGLGLLWNFSF